MFRCKSHQEAPRPAPRVCLTSKFCFGVCRACDTRNPDRRMVVKAMGYSTAQEIAIADAEIENSVQMSAKNMPVPAHIGYHKDLQNSRVYLILE